MSGKLWKGKTCHFERDAFIWNGNVMTLVACFGLKFSSVCSSELMADLRQIYISAMLLFLLFWLLYITCANKR